MTYTVQLDFWVDEDRIRTDYEVEEMLNEIFDCSYCETSNIRVLDVND